MQPNDTPISTGRTGAAAICFFTPRCSMWLFGFGDGNLWFWTTTAREAKPPVYHKGYAAKP
ncbi:MAG: hypothetical protein WAO13_00640 [Pseudolabrys sp.]